MPPRTLSFILLDKIIKDMFDYLFSSSVGVCFIHSVVVEFEIMVSLFDLGSLSYCSIFHVGRRDL